EIDIVCLQALQRLIDLPGRCIFRAPVKLGHKEHLPPEAIAQRNPHAPLAFTVVIVPTIVHEGNSTIDSPMDDLDGVRGVRWVSYVITAQPDRGYLLACLSQSSINHTVRD